jgi:membrane protease YdiL (CAAX protease family)
MLNSPVHSIGRKETNAVFTRLSDVRKGLTFYALVFGLVVIVSLLPLGEVALVVAMMMPALAVLLMLLVITRDGYSRAGWASLGLHRLGLKAWPLAVLAPLTVLGVAYGIVWASGIATFTPPAGLGALEWVTTLGQDAFQNLVIATLVFSLGEELGWRAYLLPKLASAFGNRRGMLLTGFLHGLFHMPIIFLTPYYHADGNRWLVVPMFLLAVTVGGLLFGYLRLTTGSVWPASLAHSAHNWFWGMFGGFTLATSPVAAEYLAGESGILPILGYALLALWLLTRKPLRQAQAPAEPGMILAPVTPGAI